jgi:hypothetical protein
LKDGQIEQSSCSAAGAWFRFDQYRQDTRAVGEVGGGAAAVQVATVSNSAAIASLMC